MLRPSLNVGRLAFLVAAAVGCCVTGGASAAAVESADGPLDQEKRPSGPYALRWAASPEKCLDVWGEKAGAGLQLWECADFKGADVSGVDDLHFLVPAADSTGWIQWVPDPSLCLNAPANGSLQLWYCNTYPEDHILWHVASDGSIRHQSSGSSERCVTVDTNGGTSSIANGVKVKLGECQDGDTFLIDNNVPDNTKTWTMTATQTSTRTLTVTTTETSTRTATSTSTETITVTATSTSTETATATATSTHTVSTTATATTTASSTATSTATTTATVTTTATTTTTVTATVKLDKDDKAYYLQWKGAPAKCVDAWGDKAGAMLQLWDCHDLKGADIKNDTDFRFVLPDAGSKGWIHWASDPALCVDAPVNADVQLWYCITAPQEHTVWEVSSDGQIRLASDHEKCLRIPGGIARNGQKLQLGDCLKEDDATRDGAETVFVFHEEPLERHHEGRHNASQLGGNSSADASSSAAEGSVASFIRWQGAPKQCVDVWGDHAGAVLQLWDCEDLKGADANSEHELKFLIPEDENRGFIRWASNPELCLNAPGDHEVQLWYCDTAPAAHTVWRVRGDGRIHLAEHPDKCLIVPGGVSKNGHKLKLWDCMRHSGPKHQMHAKFLVGDAAADAKTTSRTTTTQTTTHPPPESCAWSEWSEWSSCDTTCHRYQDRRIARRAAKGGKDCEGYSTRFEPCGPGLCRGRV
mmetsp:Transcript_41219/g.103499  ORF Transcript_41219/g.103499 Transcript_41219/m.103499 type:complete len:698 (+) Transcript_41219:47-2140(+)